MDLGAYVCYSQLTLFHLSNQLSQHLKSYLISAAIRPFIIHLEDVQRDTALVLFWILPASIAILYRGLKPTTSQGSSKALLSLMNVFLEETEEKPYNPSSELSSQRNTIVQTILFFIGNRSFKDDRLKGK